MDFKDKMFETLPTTLNGEQKKIFSKLDELKQDIIKGVSYDYEENILSGDKSEFVQTYYDTQKQKPHKYFGYNHKTGACTFCEYTKSGPEKQTMDYLDGQLSICRFTQGMCHDEIGYKNGVLNGHYIRQLSDKSIERGCYTNGQKDPITIKTEFYENGALKAQTHYYNGIKDGECLTFYPNGRICEEMMFDDGKKVSSYKAYYPNGCLKEESFYLNGYKTFNSIEYREDGTKCTEKHYQKGVLDGTYYEYDEQERLVRLTHYKNGRLNGMVETYDTDRVLISKEVYVNGRKITAPTIKLNVLPSRLKNGSR